MANICWNTVFFNEQSILLKAYIVFLTSLWVSAGYVLFVDVIFLISYPYKLLQNGLKFADGNRNLKDAVFIFNHNGNVSLTTQIIDLSRGYQPSTSKELVSGFQNVILQKYSTATRQKDCYVLRVCCDESFKQ